MARASKTTDVALIESKTDGAVGFEITEDVRHFALRLGVDITASLGERADRAADHMSRSQIHMLGAGLLLASIKADAQHGEFGQLIEDRGFEERTAQRAMSYARFVLSRPESEREFLLDVPHSRVLELAKADPEVVDAMLADGGGEITSLSVRKLTARIREMEDALADKDVQLETAQAQAEAAKKAAKRERANAMPLEVEDIRAEIAASTEKIRLCLLDLENLTDQTWALMSASDDVAEYSEPTARLALGGLLAVHVSIDGLVKAMHSRWNLGEATAMPLSHFTPEEIVSAAREFPNLQAVHQHEKALREWERDHARPRGKGRPAAKPEAPKKPV